ncbi:MAG TPA: PIG-L deacetylase family protein [Thermodesulfovibrionales bacterium]|nr:PIG-L deacetylase family protein [Thermodesulfovibrionales bacterium]
MADSADVLIVAAHPDDAEFGVAGTVARWVQEGKHVVYVVCTSGEKGTSDRTIKPERLAQMREKEQEDAARLLGVKEVVFLRLPDQGLEDTTDFRKMIVREIRKYRPQTVVTSDPYRRYIWHRDHRIVGQVTLDAVFPFARDHLSYPDMIEEGLEPHKVSEMLLFGSEDVNYRSDITTTFSLKVAALRCHESQMKELKVPDMEAWVREWACSMAKGAECELAEGFHRIEIKR